MTEKKTVHLNDLDSFNWVLQKDFKDATDFCKTSISGERFWLRDCVKVDEKMWLGVIDNKLLLTDVHGLEYDQKVSFVIFVR